MKKSFRKITAFLLLFAGLLNSSAVFAAEKYNLVLFYADWNVYSKNAISTLEEVSNNFQEISFEKINIDDKKAFVRMKQLGVMPTNSIPYFFLIDDDNKVLYGSSYKHESAKTISEILNKKIEN